MLPVSRWSQVEGPEFEVHPEADNTYEALASYKAKSIRFLELASGERVLDAGCGNGHDAILMSRIVGPRGQVIGLDRSEPAIQIAREVAAGEANPPRFELGDVRWTTFPDGSFDVCRTDRILQWLDEPRQAIRELRRLLRPGGRISLFEIDWRTLLLEPSARRTTGEILLAWLERYPQGSQGHEVPNLLLEAGFQDLKVGVETLLVRNFGLAEVFFHLRSMLARAIEFGAISAADASAWLEGLRQADGTRFFASITGFAVRAIRPGRKAKTARRLRSAVA